MWLKRDSPAGVRFFAALQEGRGLKPSARIAGVGKETAQRWVREAFFELRGEGLSLAEIQARLGFCSSLMVSWARQPAHVGEARHHLCHPAEVEAVFFACLAAGESVADGRRRAGVGRSTAYRWQRKRFAVLRADGVRVRAIARLLGVSLERAGAWESERRAAVNQAARLASAGQRAAVRASALHAARLQERRARPAADAREQRYWRLRGSGLSNGDACRVMGVDFHTGKYIQRRRDRQTAERDRADRWTGRFLSLPERLQIADMLLLGASLRAIGTQLGRSASTISRELDRHTDAAGRYQPHQADRAAHRQRQRPRQSRLVTDTRLRAVVQRKLNCYWSPQQIAGWLHALHPGDRTQTICAETIYQALLNPGSRCLHTRYTRKLRTGRRVRRPHTLTQASKGGAVRNMTMITDRPAEVQARIEPGHWEGDLIIGAGSASAMITLRERVTHYGLIVNLPDDHTALTVNAALRGAFAAMPAHLAKTLTWDQGAELARHQELAATSTLKIYFAERSSPWQRGANENYNGWSANSFPRTRTYLSTAPSTSTPLRNDSTIGPGSPLVTRLPAPTSAPRFVPPGQAESTP